MEPGKIYMQRIDVNANAAKINIRMGTTAYDAYRSRRVPDGINVRRFEDVGRANRRFG